MIILKYMTVIIKIIIIMIMILMVIYCDDDNYNYSCNYFDNIIGKIVFIAVW
jgi:hypothetical protein